jgi:hypothetical protein
MPSQVAKQQRQQQASLLRAPAGGGCFGAGLSATHPTLRLLLAVAVLALVVLVALMVREAAAACASSVRLLC